MWRGKRRRSELGTWRSYNPLHGQTGTADDRGLGRLRLAISSTSRSSATTPSRHASGPRSRAATTSGTTTGSGSASTRSGTGQVSYHLMVNPSGIQLDMLNSSGSGEDQSPDWIWDSAGRLNEHGYAAEIRLPLETMRFKGGDQRDDGHPVLAAREPARHVDVVAEPRAERVGVPASRAARVRPPRRRGRSAR